MSKTNHPVLKVLSYFLAMLGISTVNAQGAPWEDERKFHLSLNAGGYEANLDSYGFSAEYNGPWNFRFGGSYFSFDQELFDVDAHSLYVITDMNAPLVGQISYSVNDHQEVLRSEDWEIGVGINSGNWFWEASLVLGDIELGDPTIAPPLLAILKEIGVLDAQREGYSVGTTYFANLWVLHFSYGDFEYKRDGELTPATLQAALQSYSLQQRIQLLNDLRDFRRDVRPLFSRLQNNSYQSYRNAVSLVDSEITVDYSYLFDKFSLGGGYWWTDELLSDNEVNTLYLTADYYFSDATSIGGLVSSADDESDVYVELNLRFAW